jgi:hypothetical protein
MSNFATAFGKSFNKDAIRIRYFELGGHTFKVKIPLTSDFNAIQEKMKIVDLVKVEQYYQEIAKPFLDSKEEFLKQGDVEFLDNDIVLRGTSLQETAKNKIITENRILELFKFIVPEEEGFDMTSITYDMIEELFPFSIQLQILESINEVISPSYKATKGK